MKFLACNIEWDTDGKEIEYLPKEYILECDDSEDVVDELSNIFGWCILSLEVVEL